MMQSYYTKFGMACQTDLGKQQPVVGVPQQGIISWTQKDIKKDIELAYKPSTELVL